MARSAFRLRGRIRLRPAVAGLWRDKGGGYREGNRRHAASHKLIKSLRPATADLRLCVMIPGTRIPRRQGYGGTRRVPYSGDNTSALGGSLRATPL